MKIGHLIRAERVRQDMKQIVLAKGICTPSYLSKIERNQIEPSEDITEMLMERLGMDPGKLQGNDEETELEFEKMLMESYRKVITSRDMELAKRKLDYLENNSPWFENDSLHYTYLLILLRFRLIVGRDFNEMDKEIEALSHSVDEFDAYQMYLFKMNNALYYYNSGILKKATSFFEDIMDNLEKIPLSDWEKAEFHYTMSIIYIAESQIFIAIEYIRKALDFFMENLMMKRVLECYVIIGITRKRIEQFQEALDAYSKAMQICEDFNLHSEKGIIYHNIGSLNSTMRNSEQAIIYFKKSIESKAENDEMMISILGLIIEYSKLSQQSEVIHWANNGIDLYQKLNDKSLISYFHHFKLYKSLHSEQGLSVDIAEKAIDHFKEVHDFRHIHKYCIALAEWYYNNRKYKLSSSYYREATRYGYIYRKVENWEDL
ncbi:helix-turn-helix domain-containing protein [Sporosarcina luteola]|uniref:helix-turn-helix domain-containing protein n=1 Tax=Sporosarcina luteola TaxID=582850 RepID=UPI00203F1B6D|nr:tetratricopeptide repeat protein [Sporosarcina luteola]MCM3709033.1 tetratricopeptide repeat protein [Sporosarcina luteola]